MSLTRINSHFAGLALCVILGGCATPVDHMPSDTHGDVKKLQTESLQAPKDAEALQAYYGQRDKAIESLLQEAKQSIQQGNMEAADQSLKKILELDPNNEQASSIYRELQSSQQRQAQLAKTSELISGGNFDEAERLLNNLNQPGSPDQALVRTKLSGLDKARRQWALNHELDQRYRTERVSLEFQNAPMNSVFYALSTQSGLNFSFAPGVQLNSPTTLFVHDTPVITVLEMLSNSQHLRQKIINPNSIELSGDPAQTPPPVDNGIQTKAFYLTNTQTKSVQQLLQTLTSIRNVYVDDNLNMIIVKGPPSEIQTAAKLIAMVDLPVPEVMLEVEILEVKRDLLRNLGIEFPNQFSILNVPPTATSVTTTTGTTVTTPSTTPLTLQSLRNLNAGRITINNLMMNLKEHTGDVKLLANPRIRVKDQVQAQIKIGEKVPVFTSNATPTGVVSSSISYLDVGLNLKVKPAVLLNNDVQINIALEVSNILNQVTGNNGAVGYQIGTRNAETTLQLADGQTQILAGLISSEQQKGVDGIPGLADIPVLGRLFSNHQDSNSKTEIMLLITPHILRNLNVDSGSNSRISTTSTASSLAALNMPPSAPPALTANPGTPAVDAAQQAPKSQAKLPAGFVPQGIAVPPGVFEAKVPQQ